ncbi:hypothetical protein KAFR_0F02350 [Kazachstania africana CBS 2517]|uniref:Uncharacterized protein n=1 Tax=Kazachstania africana (strain ATCC 22294 / BCRC 22015 / CBS 2517 / CECT 1963 / NBRC 1671 / NRRL Y-8276) TaxID=1071382 RepID=H2AWT2_KAZAF|nr:hypothetical protein KAFR_0F02350 [Kazachstania africana CBS 2517]CCF58832.1 hypothetical protein KAFR_0F02350 [Kazachstania africana CBS 2517]
MSLNFLKRSMSTNIPKKIKSIIYSSHNVDDCTSVLSVLNHSVKNVNENSIVLRTLAFPINPSDINQLQGVYPSLPEKTLDLGTKEPSAIAGNEAVFEVIKVPEKKESKLSIGDWVIPLHSNQGTWTNFKILENENNVIKVNGLDLYTASTVSVNGVTAYQLVNKYINWGERAGNEWIIQNAGTSNVSKLVTQIAKAKGIKTLSVIRDRDNFQEVANDLEVKYGATKVISESQNSDKTFNKSELPKILGDEGTIKLALNSVGGKSSSSIARKLEKGGLMLTYGGMSKQPVTLPTSLHIFKGITSAGFWVTENNKKDPDEKRANVAEFIKLYETNKIISSENELEIVNWNVNEDSDEEFLNLVKKGITSSGKKKLVVLKWH